MNDQTLIHVEGMTCSNCANTVTRALQKEGLSNVRVNYLTNEVTFDHVDVPKLGKISSVISSIGYHVKDEKKAESSHAQHEQHAHHDPQSSSVVKKFWWSVVFTIPLLAHMITGHSFLHEPYVQLLLCIPVMIIGLGYFGKSAVGSIKAGLPNMDVLIFIGSSAAFIYSIAGMYLYSGTAAVHDYLFFETAASIICFVLLGNVLEHYSVRRTTSALAELSKLQPQTAKKIVSDANGETRYEEIEISEIRIGDKVFVATGEKIPADGIVAEGKASVDESMITGESIPVAKSVNDKVTGGTIVESGSLNVKVEQIGVESTLSRIIRMVKDAQFNKPEVQKLGDKVSSIFVPVVLVISAITFLFTWLANDHSFRESVMRSIAVLVISCPCAMGLATPTALMVGIGRAARNGILIKGGNTVEEFAKVKTIVFDKTGTLTTGDFAISKSEFFGNSEEEIKSILYDLEQHSTHPVARSIVREFSAFRSQATGIRWKSVEEDKGIGMNGTDDNGNLYSAGSFVMAKHVTDDDSHSIYLLKNNQLVATFDLRDKLKQGTKETIAMLKSLGIKSVMISGDRKRMCEIAAAEAGIDEYYFEQLPSQKLALVEKMSANGRTAMVGDGINDAPALAKANVGVSLSNASQIAIQSSQVILLNSRQLTPLTESLLLSRHTLLTIRQNLFWAFAYNVVAIPIAAAGLLSPAIGALSMAFSDLVLIGNSIRLRFKNIRSV